MVNVGVLFGAVAPVFMLVFLGVGLRGLGWLPASVDALLLRLVVNLFYPALILRFTIGNQAFADSANIWLPPLVGFGLVTLGFGIAWLAAPMLGLKVGSGRRTFAFATGIFNYGYLPIPIVAALAPDGEATGVLLVLNFGVELAFWTVGIIMVSGAFNRDWWRRLLNPPLMALILGVALTVTGSDAVLPGFVIDFVGMVGACAIPLGLILTGATLADVGRDRQIYRRWTVWLGAVGLRMLLLPVIFLAGAKYAPGITDELRLVLVVASAMPAGMFPIVLSKHYGGNPKVAVQVVLATTAVSLVSVPLWLVMGLRWVLG